MNKSILMIPFYGFYSRTGYTRYIYMSIKLYHIDVTVLITWYNTLVIIRNITNIFQQRTPVRTRTIILPMMICSNVQIRLSNTISLNLLCIYRYCTAWYVTQLNIILIFYRYTSIHYRIYNVNIILIFYRYTLSYINIYIICIYIYFK